MFKSIRTKYILTFMVIVVIAFLVLWMLTVSAVRNYAKEEKEQIILEKASMVQLYINDMMRANGAISLEDLPEGSWALSTLMELVTNDLNELHVILVDRGGSVVAKYGDVPYEIGQTVLSKSVVDRLNAGIGISSNQDLDGSLGNPQLVCAKSIYSMEDTPKVCGAAILYSEKAEWEDLTGLMTGVVLLLTFFVLVAVLIAISIVSIPVTLPLKRMSKAVREYATGNFEMRIPVHGKDEVAKLAEAFNSMAEDLSRLETMRNTFIANVSHDLRTPMTTIAGFVEGIIDGVIPPEKEKHYLGIVSTEVRRLSRLVSSLLDISRMEAGERKFVMAPFDICEMGRQILISFEKKIDERGLEIFFDCDDDKIVVNADRDSIYQVFYNLIDNAIKYGKEKGRLEIKILYDKERKVKITVFNEGVGIPEEDQPFVFDRFYKADKSRGLDKSGLGLGLYIVKTIVTAHNEKIWVQSTYGENCEFGFTLPRAGIVGRIKSAGEDDSSNT